MTSRRCLPTGGSDCRLVANEHHTSWRKELDGRLQAAVKPLIGDNVKQRDKALNGLAPATAFALACACRVLRCANPVLVDVACLLRSAFDVALFDFCRRKAFPFTLKCDEVFTSGLLWRAAVDSPGDLRVQQPAFVAAIEAHSDLMLADSPTRDIMEAKTQVQLTELALLLRGTSSPDDPRCVLSSW